MYRDNFGYGDCYWCRKYISDMSFIKTFFASLLAFVVGSIVLAVFGLLIFATVLMVTFGRIGNVPSVSMHHNSVLVIDLENGITDSPSTTTLVTNGLTGGISFNNSNTVLQAVSAIEQAASDNNIKGIYINLTHGGSISLANLEELRNAIVDFKQSGKFVISYSDSYSQLGYYFSSVADRVYLNPQGDIDWRGLASNVIFYKGLLDKLDIHAEILRHGSFKSAVEPFMLDHMSPENREQTTVMLESIWGSILNEVSQSRGIDSLVLSAYASALTIDSPETAFEVGMIDGLLYEDQVIDMLGRFSSGLETIESEEFVPEEDLSSETDIISDPGDDWVEVVEEGVVDTDDEFVNCYATICYPSDTISYEYEEVVDVDYEGDVFIDNSGDF